MCRVWHSVVCIMLCYAHYNRHNKLHHVSSLKNTHYITRTHAYADTRPTRRAPPEASARGARARVLECVLRATTCVRGWVCCKRNECARVRWPSHMHDASHSRSTSSGTAYFQEFGLNEDISLYAVRNVRTNTQRARLTLSIK